MVKYSILPDGPKVAQNVAERLATLVIKRRRAFNQSTPPPATKLGEKALDYLRKHVPQTTAAALWPRIVARTDQIYLTIEGMLPVYMEVMKCLGENAGLDQGDLKLAPGLKDPVRVHEKALDDYVHDFDDWDDSIVIPETCVIDMLRGMAICSNGSTMKLLLDHMVQGFETEVAGKKARVSLLRCKNYFANGGKQEPTRFRRMNANLILKYDGAIVITELQIHQRAILKYNENAAAHGPYEFFRGSLADNYVKDMDEMLERTIIFLQEMAGVPVLLSMLVLIFKNLEVNSRMPLPASRFELYSQAIRAAIGGQRDQILRMLERVAIANHMANARHFGMDLIQKALAGLPPDVNTSLWSTAEGASELPYPRLVSNPGHNISLASRAAP